MKQHSTDNHDGYDPVKWTELGDFIGISARAQEVRRLIAHYALDTQQGTVLITGEEGTGKAVVSSILHSLSV
jgi:DNA-binding NtrC family response regulator